jgi:ABC-2 type transport system ATP-binding protein
MDLLQASNIVKEYQGHRALSDVSISVPKGSIFGLLGPNGAGKTTLIRIINQITAPDSGTVIFNGHPLTREDVLKIGYLPEERGLYKKMKVGEQSLYLAQLKGLSLKEAQSTLKFWFEKFEISAWWNKKVEELSKGMQQKVQFITTVLHQPDLLIFDEPFSGFDPINVNLLKDEILKLKENGATIIFSTHNMSSVEELCDHITLINESETILEGEIGDVRDKYRSNIINVGVEGSTEEIAGKLDKKFEVLSMNENGLNKELRIKIPADSATNELIQALVPLTEIHSYNELIPSMNDIFIQAVNKASNNGKQT